MVELLQSGCIGAKVVLFGQKWLHSGKVLVFRQNRCIPAKVVIFRQSGYILGKNCCILAK